MSYHNHNHNKDASPREKACDMVVTSKSQMGFRSLKLDYWLDRDLQALIRLSRTRMAQLDYRQQQEHGQRESAGLTADDDDDDALLWDLMQRTHEVTSLLADLRP